LVVIDLQKGIFGLPTLHLGGRDVRDAVIIGG
jgi:hypothetical protein